MGERSHALSQRSLMRRPLTAVALATAAAILAVSCTSSTDTAPSPAVETATGTPAPTTASAAPPVDPNDPTGGLTAFFDPGSSADAQVLLLRDKGRTEEADLIQRIADQPIGVWLGNWTTDPTTTVGSISDRALKADQIAIFVVYNVPGRDCGLYSAGGLSEEYYLTWIQKVADGVTPGSVVWFILEPDALPQLGDCDGQGDRVGLIASAAEILDEAGGTVFLDVGHSNWKSAEVMAERIALVGTDHVAGFSTNTSNYNATDDELEWATELNALTGLPFITDTSRSGNGATEDGQWCNPRGRALGENPEVFGPPGPLLAYVWAKVPGESDGECNGGPAAGKWWNEIAVELARNAQE